MAQDFVTPAGEHYIAVDGIALSSSDLMALPRPDATYDPVLTTNPVSWVQNASRAAFAKSAQTQSSIDNLSAQGSDASMSRGLEDLVGLLIAKGTIAKTDLPAPLLTKIDNRRAVRGQAAL